MRKYILLLALILPILFAGCSSPEDNARKEIMKRCDAIIKSGAKYTIDKCIYAADNDSCFIFSGETIAKTGERSNFEYLYRQTKDNLLIGLKFVDFNGSLLRNMNKNVNTGSSMDDIVNAALQGSGLGLSATIYTDLQNGSLLDITDAETKIPVIECSR